MSKSNHIFCIDEIGLRRVLRDTILRNLIVKDSEFENAFIEGCKKEERECQRLNLPPWDKEELVFEVQGARV